MMFSPRISALMMAVLMIGVATRVAEGQSTPSCASKLVGCANYINSTSPPSSCCDPLKEAVTKELDCLCKLYENPVVLQQFGINITQALLLPQRCGISGDISACKASGPASSTTPSPPATPGNGVGKIAWGGLSSLLLLCASVMLC